MAHGVRHQLSVSQFAWRYGRSQRTIDELTSYLGSFGIKTTVYADHVDIAASGTAGQFDKAMAVQQHNYRLRAALRPAQDRARRDAGETDLDVEQSRGVAARRAAESAALRANSVAHRSALDDSGAMTSSTASTHAVSHARAATFMHGMPCALPTYPKLEVTERPARIPDEPRLPENSA